MRIVFSTPTWVISGVNSFTHNLMRSLQRRGHDVELLVINQGLAEAAELPLPTDVPVNLLEFDRTKTWWMSRWEALRDYLQASGPTVYFSNYDFENSAVIPALKNDVAAIGIVHSDDPHHYEQIERLGRYWNAVVSVSSMLHEAALRIDPSLNDRAFKIGYGVPHDPELRPSQLRGSDILKIIYAGRFNEEQKRVSDLVAIAYGLKERRTPFHLTLIGNGPREAALKTELEPLVQLGCVDFPAIKSADEMLQLYGDYDCLVLTSNYEGLPLALLESMWRGCVPVVTNLRSGIPDVIRDGENGFALPVGDGGAFVDCFSALQADRDRRQRMSRSAFETISKGAFGIERVADRYSEVLDTVRQNIDSGNYIRPKPFRPNGWTGDFVPPPQLQISPDVYYSLKWRYDQLATQLAERDGQIALLQSVQSEGDKLRAERAELQKQLQGMEATIAAIRCSTSWRITYPLRATKRVLGLEARRVGKSGG